MFELMQSSRNKMQLQRELVKNFNLRYKYFTNKDVNNWKNIQYIFQKKIALKLKLMFGLI
jgi:hypothetical protein